MTIDPTNLHREAFVADLHCDAWHPISRGYDIGKRHEDYHIDIPRLIEGGVSLEVFATFVNPFFKDKSPREFVERAIATQVAQFQKYPDKITLVRTTDEISQVRQSGKIAALLAIEGGEALQSDPSTVEHYHDLGVRIITIVHNRSLDWCISHSDQSPAFDGLTNLGREMIGEMNRLGIIIDLSHSADTTVEQVLNESTAQVIASHSCARGLVDHTRNLPDDLIKGIADTGGLIGVTFVSQFLSQPYADAEIAFFRQRPELTEALSRLFVSEMPIDELNREWGKYTDDLTPLEKALTGLRPSVKDVVDHIEYIVGLVGADHVAIGSDYDGITTAPKELEDCSRMPNLTHELVCRGYSEVDIKKILGENLLRVFGQICG